MKIRLSGTEVECRHAGGRTPEATESYLARETGSAPTPVVVTRARHQLRERIQRAETALTQAGEPAHKRTHEPERSTSADREAEP